MAGVGVACCGGHRAMANPMKFFDDIKRFIVYWSPLFALLFFVWIGFSFMVSMMMTPQVLKRGTLGAIGDLEGIIAEVQGDLQSQIDNTNKKADHYYDELLYDIQDIRKQLNLPKYPPIKPARRAIPSAYND